MREITGSSDTGRAVVLWQSWVSALEEWTDVGQLEGQGELTRGHGYIDDACKWGGGGGNGWMTLLQDDAIHGVVASHGSGKVVLDQGVVRLLVLDLPGTRTPSNLLL